MGALVASMVREYDMMFNELLKRNFPEDAAKHHAMAHVAIMVNMEPLSEDARAQGRMSPLMRAIGEASMTKAYFDQQLQHQRRYRRLTGWVYTLASASCVAAAVAWDQQLQWVFAAAWGALALACFLGLHDR